MRDLGKKAYLAQLKGISPVGIVLRMHDLSIMGQKYNLKYRVFIASRAEIIHRGLSALSKPDQGSCHVAIVRR